MLLVKKHTICLIIVVAILLASFNLSKPSEVYGRVRFRDMAIDATGFYNLRKMDLRTLYLYSSYDNKVVSKDHIKLVLYAISNSETPISVTGLNMVALGKKNATKLNNEQQYSIYEISSAQIGDIEKHPASKGAVHFILSARFDPAKGVVYDIIPADKNYIPLPSLGDDGTIKFLKSVVASLNPSPPAKPNGIND